jgi:NTE family protein
MTRKIVLLLQGGGSLGAFQCGVWQALAPFIRESRHELVAIAGASIGAINAGLIARYYHEDDGGSGMLRTFWRKTLATQPAPFIPLPGSYWRAWNGLLTGLLLGNPSLFSPLYQNWNPIGDMLRFTMPLYQTGNALRTLSGVFGEYRGTAPLLLTGATDVQTGRTVLFDSARRTVTPQMLVASMSIPILFPPTRIDGRYLWDPEMRSSTLLPDLLELLRQSSPEPQAPQDYLVVVVDMFTPATREMPTSMMQSAYRLMNIVLGNKAKYDQREFDAANAHIDAMERLRGLTVDAAPPALAAAIEQEYHKVVAQRRARVEFIHVDRDHVKNEYISRDFDYSLEYIDSLIAQGEQCAKDALARYLNPATGMQASADIGPGAGAPA